MCNFPLIFVCKVRKLDQVLAFLGPAIFFICKEIQGSPVLKNLGKKVGKVI